MFELQEIKTALLDEIQNAFKDKKNPMLAEYEEQTQNLLALAFHRQTLVSQYPQATRTDP